MMPTGARGPSKLPARRFHRLLFGFSRPIAVAGFDARAFGPDDQERAQITAKLVAALELLQRHAPTRLAALRRDLPRIWVGPTHSLAKCIYGASMCLLRFEYVTDDHTTPRQLAMTLVHEGMHARLLRADIPYDERCRRRVERLCVLAEVIFARRLPDARADVSDAEERLDRSDEFWSDAARDQRALDALSQLGFLSLVGYAIIAPVLYIRRFLKKRAA